MRLRFLVLFLPLLFPTFACSIKSIGVRTTGEILGDGIAAFEAESDVTLAHEAAAAQIKLLEALYRSDPANPKVLISLTRALSGYAFVFLDQEAETDANARARAAGLYFRGKEYGLKLLDLRLGQGTLQNARTGSQEDWEKRLKKAGKDDVPAMFWTGYSWAGGIRKTVNSPSALAELPKAVALIERVLALSPDYHYGSPHLFMGVYYADRPKMAGGNPVKASEHFDAGLKASDGKFMMGRYLWARFGAVQAQDSKLFSELLGSVILSPEDLLPEQRLSQEVARNWARKLLKQKPSYFVEE